MACISKRRGKWVLDFYDHQGKRRVQTVDGTRKDAERLLAKRIQEIGRGDYQAEREQMLFQELAQAYTVGHIAVNIRENTRRDYERNIRLYLLPYFSGVKVRSITPEMVEAFRTRSLENGVGRRTVNKCHTLLSAILRYAMRYRWISFNAAAEVRKLRDERQHQGDSLAENILTPLEVKKLLESTDDRWRVIILMALSTGMRQGELLGLKWGDIDWTAKQVHVRQQYTCGRLCELKTKSSRRSIGLSNELTLELKKWKLRCPKGEHDLVFPSGAGNHENHGNLLRRGFYPALRRAGLRKITFHSLRHSFASFLIAKNVHPKRIQALMGHSSIKITMDVYGHLMKDSDNEAANSIVDFIFGNKTVTTGLADAVGASQVIEKMVARDGIEPPTRGFSVRCSTN